MRVSVKVKETSMTGNLIFDLRKRGNCSLASDLQIVMRTEIAEYLKDLVNKDQESKDQAIQFAGGIIDSEYDALLEMSKDDLFDYLVSGYDKCKNLTKEDSDILWYDHLEPF